ncbi:hypothetical protein JOD43_004028 [Pullulanibacillus pueri]|nr:hypothetical protein [Pullulanibacillus pueri]
MSGCGKYINNPNPNTLSSYALPIVAGYFFIFMKKSGYAPQPLVNINHTYDVAIKIEHRPDHLI